MSRPVIVHIYDNKSVYGRPNFFVDVVLLRPGGYMLPLVLLRGRSLVSFTSPGATATLESTWVFYYYN